jgi:ABC-type glycerol-3-phosphate transport system substrate-binding protein
MHTKNISHTLRVAIWIGLLVILSTIVFSGCRTKCVEGSKSYPECLGEDNPNRVIPTITLEFWNLHDQADIYRGAIQRFERKPRNDFNVKINYKTFTNETKYEEYLMSKMAQGEGPDIFAMHHSWLPKHQKKISPMPESSGMTPEMLRQKFQAVAANAVIKKDPVAKIDRIYGLPLYVDTLALYYNKNLFSKLNPDETNQPRETWEQIKKQTVEIKKEDQNSLEKYTYTGIAMGREDNIKYGIDILSMLFLQYGVELVEDDYKKINFDNTEIALKEYKSFEHGALEYQANWNQLITGMYPKEKDLGAFVRNKVGMIFGYSSTYQELVDLIDEHKNNKSNNVIDESDIGIAEAPQIKSREDMREGEFPVYLADFHVLTVSAGSTGQKQDLAWSFLNEIATDEANFLKEYYEKTKKPSALISGISDTQKKEKTFGVFSRQIQFSKTFPYLDKDDYNTLFSEAVSKARKRGVSQVLENAKNGMECVLQFVTGRSRTPDADCTEF